MMAGPNLGLSLRRSWTFGVLKRGTKLAVLFARHTAALLIAAIACISPPGETQTVQSIAQIGATRNPSVSGRCEYGSAVMSGLEGLDGIPFVAQCGRANPAECADRFELTTKSGVAYQADALSIGADGIVHFRNDADHYDGHVHRDDLDAIHFGPSCPRPIEISPGPQNSGVCIEPMQYAVNFSYDAPLPNAILTRGFSYHLEFKDQGMRTTEEIQRVRTEVRQMIVYATMNWFAALQDHQDVLDAEVKVFLGSLISKSDSYSLLIPPQVIELECPDSAAFIIQIHDSTTSGPFAETRRGGQTKYALAQTPGRTILLNYKDACWSADISDYIYIGKCVNGIALMTHEIGHAFGLPHLQTDDSIMRSSLNDTTKPSKADVEALSKKLLATIEGGRPGEFQSRGSSGVSINCANGWQRRLILWMRSSALLRRFAPDRPLICPS